MLVAFICLSQAPAAEIIRGDYGEPHVFGRTLDDAFYGAGYAVAQDRLWQMELSRRSARGKLSEILGRTALASDQDAVRFGYTDAEYQAMWLKLSSRTQGIFESYCKGVNAWIAEASASNKLPKSFETKPVDWTPQDCMAISVNLVRLFGRGGAGEIRDLLLYTYLKDRLKDKTLDAFQDLLWQNDRAAITTVADGDDPHKGSSPFRPLSPTVLAKQIAEMPKVNLLELLPGLRIEEQADMIEMAERLGVPSKWGSYAMVIGKDRSATGVPLLLNGPQMGFSSPSVVHMMSISCPEYTAVGMNVPGIPGVLVGHTPYLAWGVTSGVADTDDIFFVKLNEHNPERYQTDGGGYRDFDVVKTEIKVKGDAPVMGQREMCAFGNTVIKSTGTGVAYVRKSSLWMREVENVEAILGIGSAKSVAELGPVVAHKVSASFNLFAADNGGNIGWYYCARVPLRAASVDPRLPAFGTAANDWTGFVPPERMPYTMNPKRGVIANWNNKPVSWWPNLDTPIWGRIFRNEAITRRLEPIAKISAQDLEKTARAIAMSREDYRYFLPEMLAAVKTPKTPSEAAALSCLSNWDGAQLEGSVAPMVFDAWFDAVREELFVGMLGTFMAPANFKLVVQPTLTWNALHGKTRVNYLGKRKASEVYAAAFSKAVESLTKRLGTEVASWDYRPGYISWKGIGTVPYSDRGTYIQVVELWKQPFGRCVIPPGISEDSASKHYSDQKDLAAAWMYFPMLWRLDSFPAK